MSYNISYYSSYNTIIIILYKPFTCEDGERGADVPRPKGTPPLPRADPPCAGQHHHRPFLLALAPKPVIEHLRPQHLIKEKINKVQCELQCQVSASGTR